MKPELPITREGVFTVKLVNKTEPILIRTFGGLTVYRNSKPVMIAWSSQKARLLFCYLLITSDQWVHRERLIELLWPGGSYDGNIRNFTTTLSRLRKSLRTITGRDPVIGQGDAYRLNFEAITCDSSTYRSEVVAGIRLMTRGDVTRGREHLENAQQLYSSEFLPEEPDDPFIDTARSTMAGLHDTMMKYLNQIYATEERSVYFESLRDLTHFPAFPCHEHRRQARFSSVTV
jgi:DNA-binding SARP family transcriptional activator